MVLTLYLQEIKVVQSCTRFSMVLTLYLQEIKVVQSYTRFSVYLSNSKSNIKYQLPSLKVYKNQLGKPLF